MSELKVSVSGIRGIWGDSLTLETLMKYTRAFGAYIKSQKGKKVLIGRDGRPTGAMISMFVTSVLKSIGLDVIDCGIVPTPTVLYGVRDLKLGGGLIITASHNPVEWNALKFVKAGGVFTGEKDLETILKLMDTPVNYAAYNKIGNYIKDDKVSDSHIQTILKNIDVKLIQSKQFKVVLDPVNSAGSIITDWLLHKLECRTTIINQEIDGTFHRETEPTPENLTHLEPLIREVQADVGFAQDPDADRLVVVDETGRVLSEELTLALAVQAALSREKGPVVINMSTSRVIEDIAEKFDVPVYRTKVGEANVVEGIQEYGAVIGGEGNGGVIYPRINIARDSLVGIVLILERMAQTGFTLSKMVNALPQYYSRKEKFRFEGEIDLLYDKIAAEFESADLNYLDGLRLDWMEGGSPVWIHIRPSNTEPVIRVIGEATGKAPLDRAFEKVTALLS